MEVCAKLKRKEKKEKESPMFLGVYIWIMNVGS